VLRARFFAPLRLARHFGRSGKTFLRKRKPVEHLLIRQALWNPLLSCWVRVLLFGTLPKICYAEGKDLLFVRTQDSDLRLAQVRRAALRENAERLAAENGVIQC
jgi:hypothetical protein